MYAFYGLLHTVNRASVQDFPQKTLWRQDFHYKIEFAKITNYNL